MIIKMVCRNNEKVILISEPTDVQAKGKHSLTSRTLFQDDKGSQMTNDHFDTQIAHNPNSSQLWIG